MNSSPYASYRENQVLTASSEKLVIMLYDGVINFCTRALGAFPKQDWEAVHNNLLRCQDILAELMVTVDQNIEVGRNLYLLYEYMFQSLVEANVKKDAEIITRVKEMLEGLREAWFEAATVAKNEASPQENGPKHVDKAG